MNIPEQIEKNLEETTIEKEHKVSKEFFDKFIKEIKELSAKQKIEEVVVNLPQAKIIQHQSDLDYLVDSMEIEDE